MDRNRWIKALWAAKLAKRISPNAYLIGRALLRRVDRHWRCWPSLETLAADVGCCVRTVARAIQALRQLGLLDWEARRAAWNRRASNLYKLIMPQEVRKNLFDSVPKPSCPSAPTGPELAASLARLGAVMGCSPAEVMPWLTV